MRMPTPELNLPQESLRPRGTAGGCLMAGVGSYIFLLLRRSAVDRIVKNVLTDFNTKFDLTSEAYLA